MGKRSDLGEPRDKDKWYTIDPDAVTNLLPFVAGRTYAEVCAGDGSLVELLYEEVNCAVASDMEPTFNELKHPNETKSWITQKNALDYTKDELRDCDFIITNPPFSWVMLKPLLDHLPTLKPTWLLLPAGSMHNVRMHPYMSICKKVVAVGRLYWIVEEGADDPTVAKKNGYGKGIKGKDDYIWALFDANYKGPTEFVPRKGKT